MNPTEKLRADVKQLEIRDLEERDRRGYASGLASNEEDWESEGVWPEQ
jgi:hypothetical protein